MKIGPLVGRGDGAAVRGRGVGLCLGAHDRGGGAKASNDSPTQTDPGFARHEPGCDPEVGLLFNILIGAEEELDAGFEQADDDGSAARDGLAEFRVRARGWWRCAPYIWFLPDRSALEKRLEKREGVTIPLPR
jgi:hypothetical protein